MTVKTENQVVEVADPVARAEIAAIRKDFSKFTENIDMMIGKVFDKIGALERVLAETRGDLQSRQDPMGLMDIIKSGTALGVFVALLIGGVSYVVSSSQGIENEKLRSALALAEARANAERRLLQYRLGELEQPTVNRYVKLDRE